MEQIINSYAKALFLVSDNRMDIIRREVKFLLEFFARYHESLMFLSSPIISIQRKKELILCMEGCVDSILLKFIIVVCMNKRFNLLLCILEKFLSLVREHNNELEIIITSSKLLKGDEIKSVTESLNFLGNIVKVSNMVESSLLGGYTVRYNFNMIDMSTKSCLEKLVHMSREVMLQYNDNEREM